jgi:hypothetical protein
LEVTIFVSPEQPVGEGQQDCDFIPAGLQTPQVEHIMEQLVGADVLEPAVSLL